MTVDKHLVQGFESVRIVVERNMVEMIEFDDEIQERERNKLLIFQALTLHIQSLEPSIQSVTTLLLLLSSSRC